MKSKLYLSFALLALAAVFAAPGLTAPPVAAWVSPAGQPLTQALQLQVSADAGVTAVQFFIDDVPMAGTVVEGPADTFGFAFDPDDYANGVVTLRADLTNPDGTTTITQPDVLIQNAADAPTWTSLADGDTVGSSALLQAVTAIEYDGVEFFLDGVSVGQAVEEGFTDSNDWRLDFDAAGYALGAHVLSAVATNGGLTSAPADVDVTFVDDVDPVVGSYSPVDGSDVSGSFTFTVSATDNVGATGALYSLDGSSFVPMASAGGGVFTATVDVSALPNGIAFLSVEVYDARDNTTPGSTSINIANPAAPVLDTVDLYWFGSTQVGAEGMQAGDATATGTPTPTVSYSWRVCVAGGACNSYAGSSYAPVAGDVGRTVELVVRASNGVDPQDTFSTTIGTVTAADPVFVEPVVVQPVVVQPVVPPVVVSPVVAPPVAAPPVVVAPVLGVRSPAAQKVSGTAGADRIATGSGNDVIRAGAGNDVIFPGTGRDLVYAGPGNDTVHAMKGRASVNCGTGADTLYANAYVRSVGCEKVVVASNNKLVTVKVGADGKPVMPANFNGPYATTPKARIVVAAEQKAAAAVEAAAATKALVAVAEQKAVAASKTAAASTAAVLADAKRLAAAEARLASATAAAAASANAAVAAAKSALAASDTKAVAATTSSAGAARVTRGVIEKHDAAVKKAVAVQTAVVVAEKKVAVAVEKTVAVQTAVVAQHATAVKGFAAAVKAASPAREPVAAAKLAVAVEKLGAAKDRLGDVKATSAAQQQRIASAQVAVRTAFEAAAAVRTKLALASDKVTAAAKLAAAAKQAAARR